MTSSSRIAVCATLVAICLSGGSVLTQRAGSIASISPAAARSGDTVTITGNGFGAFNVRVTVGGVPALVMAANGSRVTFRVPAGVPQGATTVTATNPGGQSGSIAFTLIEGLVLGGPPAGRALDALFDVPPVSAKDTDVVDGIIMTRLVLRLRQTATVGQLNAALLGVGGGIVSMAPRFPTLTIAIPRPSSFDALQAIAASLSTAPGISSASLARVPEVREVPQDAPLDELDHLLPTRFPAAWHVRSLVTGCPGGPVPIVVLDNFDATRPTGFDQQVPNFSLPDGTSVDSHGYLVTGTLGASFDAVLPTGANPFATCLQIIGVDAGYLAWTDVIRRVVHEFPAGKFIVNNSNGYKDKPPVDSQLPSRVMPPIDRARDALDWKTMAASRASDFLLVNSAGNEFNKPATSIYAGLGQAAFDSPMNVAAKTDPTFSFVQSAQFWSDVAHAGFPSIAADDLEFEELQRQIALRGLGGVVSDNVVVAGSTSSALSGFADLVESDFSDRGSDIKAVGEAVTLLGPVVAQGTSLAAPQIAGLASYLWLLSPELRALPIQTTMHAILDNARSVPLAGKVVDAYAAVLSLDPGDALCSSSPCIRQAIVDVNGDGRFDDLDLIIALQHYFLVDARSSPTTTEVTPKKKDWGRFDLNGDGFTGGPSREVFDLDPTGSTQFGAAQYLPNLREHFENTELVFDENGVTDLQILCYYAYSSLYLGDVTRRSELLAPRCTLGVSVSPTSANLHPGDTRQFFATVTPSNDPRVTWTATGGTITNSGLYTAGTTAGTFSVRAISTADPSKSGSATVNISPSGVGIPGRWVGEITELRPFGFLSHNLTVDVSGTASAISGSFVITPVGSEPTLTGTLTATMDGTRVLTFSMTLDGGQCPADAPFPPLDIVSSRSGVFQAGTNLNSFRTDQNRNVPLDDRLHGVFFCRPTLDGPFLYDLQPLEIVFQGPF